MIEAAAMAADFRGTLLGDQARNARQQSFCPSSGIFSMVQRTMTVWADADRILDGVRSTVREWTNVMDLEESCAIGGHERSWLAASLTTPRSRGPYPSRHCRIPPVDRPRRRRPVGFAGARRPADSPPEKPRSPPLKLSGSAVGA